MNSAIARDIPASSGDQSPARRANVWLEQVVAHMAPTRAFVMNAGDGRDALWLAEQSWRVLATEPTPMEVARLRRLGREVLASDRYFMTLKHNPVMPVPGMDFKLSLLVDLDVDLADWPAVLRAVATATARGGRVLVVASGQPGGTQPAHGLTPAVFQEAASDIDLDLQTCAYRQRRMVSGGTMLTIKDTVAVLSRP